MEGKKIKKGKISKVKLQAQRKAAAKQRKTEIIIRELEKSQKSQHKEENTEKVDGEENCGRTFTVSVAIPGSILDNAQSPELRTYLAGQIARSCVVFQVDEIVVYDDACKAVGDETTEGNFTGIGKKGNCNVQLARILQYLECPQYLRKAFFPRHHDLMYAGILNPLDCPHHMRATDFMPYREGVVVDRPLKAGRGSFVNCGILDLVQIDKVLRPNIRVTIKMQKQEENPMKFLQGKVVSPDTPRTKGGLYWGYSVRLASSLSNAIVNCPFEDPQKYDVTIGTSERGNPVDSLEMPKFKHVLIVFGGLQGIEAGLDSDTALEGVDDPSTLFSHYLNTCPTQGSRTIRTEEAILITLSALRSKIFE